jgi:hypothetical protein
MATKNYNTLAQALSIVNLYKKINKKHPKFVQENA